MTDPKNKRRRRGAGTLFKLKNSRFWYARYYAPDGRRITKATKTEDHGEASRKLNAWLVEQESGAKASSEPAETTFGDLATMILTDYRNREQRSWGRLQDALAHLASFFGGEPVYDPDQPATERPRRVLSYSGGCRVQTIKPRKWAEYVALRRRQGAATATIHAERAALVRAFTLATEDDDRISPPRLPSFGKLKNERDGSFSDEEAEAIIRELAPELRPMIRFGWRCGWRIQSELQTLRWEHVDCRTWTVTLDGSMTKNGEPRTLPCWANRELRSILETQREQTTALERATGRIITHVFHRNGRPILDYRTAWCLAVDRAAHGGKAPGEPREVVYPNLLPRTIVDRGSGRTRTVRPIPHDFRRTTVRSLEAAGVSWSVGMVVTGHLDPKTYARYARVKEQDAARALAALDGGQGETAPTPTRALRVS